MIARLLQIVAVLAFAASMSLAAIWLARQFGATVPIENPVYGAIGAGLLAVMLQFHLKRQTGPRA